MRKKVFIVLLILSLIVLLSYLYSPVRIKYFGTDYKDYAKVVDSSVSFYSKDRVVGDKVGVKVNGKNKDLKIDYELWDRDTIYQSDNVMEYPITNGFDGDIAFLLRFNGNKEDDNVNLYVDLDSEEGGHGTNIDIENFLYGYKGIFTINSEKTSRISFGEEEIFYSMAVQDSNGNYRWSLILKLIVE